MLNTLFKFVEDVWRRQNNGSDLPDKDKWLLQDCKGDIPVQHNGYDCGVFCCMYAECIANDKPISFTQENIPMYRQMISTMITNTQVPIDINED